jgi:hypothetical protein
MRTIVARPARRGEPATPGSSTPTAHGHYPDKHRQCDQVQVRMFLRHAYRMPRARIATKMAISATVTKPNPG